MEDRFERLTNLVTFLLEAREGATFARIVQEIPGWPDSAESRRRAFERDKRILRDEGIPLVEENGVYRIPPERFYLPDLDLSEDEQIALRLAVAAVPGVAGAGGSALRKLTLAGLGGLSALDDPAPVVAALDDQPLVPTLHEAVRARAPISFVYAGAERHLEPALVFFRDGNWYVSGNDTDRGASRTFRVDRIEEEPTLGPAGSFDRPASLAAEDAMPRQAWLYGEDADAEEAVVEVDAVLASAAAHDVAGHGQIERRSDGSAVITMAVTNRAAFRTWVLGMREHAVVLGSPELRAHVVEWLRALAEASR